MRRLRLVMCLLCACYVLVLCLFYRVFCEWDVVMRLLGDVVERHEAGRDRAKWGEVIECI